MPTKLPDKDMMEDLFKDLPVPPPPYKYIPEKEVPVTKFWQIEREDSHWWRKEC